MPANFKLVFNGVALLLGLSLALGLCVSPASDGDVWRQAAAGEAILKENAFPSRDTTLAMAPDQAFDSQGWLFSVTAYGLHRLAGFRGLQGFKTLCLLAALALCVATAFRRQSRPFSAAVFSIWAAWALAPSFGSHSQALSLALFSAALFLMEGSFWNSFFARWIWLPILVVVWCNFDGQALIVLPLACLWVAAEAGAPDEPHPAAPRLLKVLFAVVLAACFFVTPLGAGLLLRAPGPSSTLFAGGGGVWSLESAQPALLLMAVLAGLLVASAWVPEGRAHLLRDTLIFVWLAAAGFLRLKLLPYFCLWAVPVAAWRLDLLLDAVPGWLKAARWVAKLGLLGLGVWILPRLYKAPSFGLLPATYQLPKETADFLGEQGIHEPVFTDVGWAGYLEWQGKGQNPVFMDGRGAPDALAREYRECIQGKAGYAAIFEKHGVEAALVPVESPLSKVMAYALDWQPVCFDDVSVLYLKSTPAHKGLIQTFAPRGLRPRDPMQPVDLHRLQQAEADLEPLLARSPGLGRLYLYQAALYQAQGDAARQVDALKAGLKNDPRFAPNYNWLGSLLAKKGFPEEARRLYQRSLALKADEDVALWMSQLKPAF